MAGRAGILGFLGARLLGGGTNRASFACFIANPIVKEGGLGVGDAATIDGVGSVSEDERSFAM